MANSLFELLQQCTVSLKVGTSEGTGFFVAPGLILTCAHVIKGIRAEVNNEITVKWNNNNYTVIHQSDQQESNDCSLDLALLNLEFSEHPYVYLSEDVEPFDRLYSYGYSDYCPNGAPVTVLCEGLTGDNPKLIKFKGGQIRPGLSGSPVLNVRTGEVCGVITKTFDRGSDLGGEAITTTAILSRFPELEKLQKGNTFGLWANYLETETVRDRLHNLPNQNLPPQLTKFVGRYNQLEDLIKCLNQKNFITVGGIGGIGKTALVIEAAYRCLEARNSHQSESQIPQFDTIIFTSAKRKELDYSGTVDCSSVQSNLFDILALRYSLC